MFQEVMKNHPHLNLSLLALLIFIAVFLVALLWTFRPGAASIYRETERLPLNKD